MMNVRYHSNLLTHISASYILDYSFSKIDLTLLMIHFHFFLITVQENAEQRAIAFLGVIQIWQSNFGVHLQHLPW